jgi:hypothetical protein
MRALVGGTAAHHGVLMAAQVMVAVQDNRVPRQPPRVRGLWALLLSALVAFGVGLSEVDHVLSQIARDGQTWSPTKLTSLSTILDPREAAAGWAFFADQATAQAPHADAWLRAYGVVDALFALTYVLMAWLIWRATEGLTSFGAGVLVIGGLGDLAEDALLIVGAGHLGWGVVVCTYVKWTGVVAGIGVLWFSERSRVLRVSGHLLHALYTHRYTLIVLLPLAVLGLARGTDILEQLPDIQRAWFDQRHVRDPLAAGLVLTFAGIAFLYVGRQRTDSVWLRTCDKWVGADHPCAPGLCEAEDRQLALPRPDLQLWFFAPALLGSAAIVMAIAKAEIRLVPLGVFIVMPVAVGAFSLWLRPRLCDQMRPIRKPVSVARYDVTAVVGDALVGTFAIVAGLASIRAFAGLTLLEPRHPGNWFMLVVGLGAVLLTWPIHIGVLRWVDNRAATVQAGSTPSLRERLLVDLTPGIDNTPVTNGAPPPPEGFKATFRHQRWNWRVLAGALAVLLLTASMPMPVARGFGVIGTFELALTSLTLLIAASVVLLQRGGAPEVFWLMRVPYAPVTTLLVVAAVFAGTQGKGVHDIRDYPDSGPGSQVQAKDRPTLAYLFDTWLEAGDDCAVPGKESSPLKVRPLLLYAAEGGGIRAAYWTTRAVDRIGAERSLGVDDDGDGKDDDVPAICRSAFLSSGASGGSVGLSIASVEPLGAANKAVEAISGPQALAAASDGLVARDTIYAATGVPLPSIGGPDGTDATDWADRGTLIEQSWGESVPGAEDDDPNDGVADGLEQPFLRTPDDWTWTPPGALVINSTSTTTSCRTLISQIKLTSSPGRCTTGAEPTSEGDRAGAVSAADSTDLLSCTGQVHTTTAALLTARFPYVTPSGVVSCGAETLQVVDGGYAENFGVGTLVDLAPQLMRLVRQHNNCVLDLMPSTECTGVAPETLVAPMLVYLDNGTGTDLVEQPGDLDLEILVPPLTLLSAKGQLYDARSQLERAEHLFATDQLWGADTSEDAPDPDAALSQAATLVDDLRTNPVAIVFQATKPQVAGPLGWVLSEASMRSMDSALCSLDADVLDAVDSADQPDPLFDTTLADVMKMLPGTAVEKCTPSRH